LEVKYVVVTLLGLLRMVYICQLCSFSSPMISGKTSAIKMQGVSFAVQLWEAVMWLVVKGAILA